MQYFKQLAALTYQYWNHHNRDSAALPEASALALRELPAHQHVSSSDIVQWVSTTPVLPTQLDPQSQFGDPPITVFNDDCLIIDIYFWLDSSTSIHQHAFAGAFYVLEGASVETVYDFDVEHRYNQCLLTGDLRRREIRINRQGDCRPILPGPEFIHSLFHLDHPSVSLVIRTGVPSAAPQLDYWYPRIAIQHDSGATPLQRRRLELIPMLGSSRPDELHAYLRTIFAGASPQEVLWGLQRALPLFRGRVDTINELLREQRQLFGPLIDDAIASFKETGHVDSLTALRQQATSPGSRLLLAFLLNARSAGDLISLVQSHSQCQDPVEETLRLAAQLLSEVPLSRGSSDLSPEDFPLALSIVRQFLMETPATELPARLARMHPEADPLHCQELTGLLAGSKMFRLLCPAPEITPSPM